MAHPPSPPRSSPPPLISAPSYGTLDLESQNSPLLPLRPLTPSTPHPPCPNCSADDPLPWPRPDPRGWIHALLGLQGARDPNYHEEDFMFVLLAAFGWLVVIMGLTLVAIFVPGGAGGIMKLILLGVVVMCLFSAFPAPWCGDRSCS